MNRIKELFNAILLKKESLSVINEYNLKKIPLFFLITNIVFPFIYNICFLILNEDINISNVMSILYFIMWNIIINLALIFSLWLIFYISKKKNSIIHKGSNFHEPFTAVRGFFELCNR